MVGRKRARQQLWKGVQDWSFWGWFVNAKTGDWPFAPSANARYGEVMDKVRGIDFDDPAPVDGEENEETLAAIEEGIRDAGAGHTVPIEEVRRLLPGWITASSSQKKP